MSDFDGVFQALSPDGNRAVLATKGVPALLDVETGTELAKVRYGNGWFRSNQVYQTLIVIRDLKKRNKVISFDATTGKQIKEIEIEQKGDRFYQALEKSEIVFVSKSATIQIWDATSESWKRQVSLQLDASESLSLDSYAGAVSPDGNWLYSQMGKQTFGPAIFDLTTGAVAARLPTKVFFPHTPAFVPNRDILMANAFAGAKKNWVVAYDAKANAIVGKFGNMESSVKSLAVSGDGSTLAVGTWEGEIAVFNLKKLK